METNPNEELLALASVGLLSEDEEADFRRCVGSCCVMRQQARALRDTAALLAYLAGPYRPSPRLKVMILREIDRRKLEL